jgi:PIN domain nuclease of toxin-antitoxin system
MPAIDFKNNLEGKSMDGISAAKTIADAISSITELALKLEIENLRLTASRDSWMNSYFKEAHKKEAVENIDTGTVAESPE